jgi:hypothetical protein
VGLKSPQSEGRPPSGGADAWDNGLAGEILSADFFDAEAAPEYFSGGSSAGAVITAAGAGTAREAASGGAAATLTATAAGAGTAREATSGGAGAGITVTAAGAGVGPAEEQHESGGASAGVIVSAVGGGAGPAVSAQFGGGSGQSDVPVYDDSSERATNIVLGMIAQIIAAGVLDEVN